MNGHMVYDTPEETTIRGGELQVCHVYNEGGARVAVVVVGADGVRTGYVFESWADINGFMQAVFEQSVAAFGAPQPGAPH
jgi:hypothetical protein